ncbi:putative permease [Salmonella enterica subsp. enterica]|uniref:Putative permease n=1 Tax=Salmonella enterica I TaxID=59201 RepID=A0A447TT79_SALET|nr:putative permease [Salmonella enterica subsp. enterica]
MVIGKHYGATHEWAIVWECSTLVVFLSLLVWGWLLGPVGMLLSVPLTSVCKIWMETTKGGSKLAILLGPGRPKSRLPG